MNEWVKNTTMAQTTCAMKMVTKQKQTTTGN